MRDESERPVEFWGLKAIGKRMGCSAAHLRRLNDKMGFPMILMLNPNRRHPHNLSSKWMYYINEPLIFQWQNDMYRVQQDFRRKAGRRWWTKENREKMYRDVGGPTSAEEGQGNRHT